MSTERSKGDQQLGVFGGTISPSSPIGYPGNVSICSESEKGANGSDIRRCEEVIIPDCVDKTVQCSNPPTSIKGATIQKLETFQTKTSSWCGEKAKYIGKVLEKVELSSFLDCQTLCQNSSDCNFFSFDAVFFTFGWGENNKKITTGSTLSTLVL